MIAGVVGPAALFQLFGKFFAAQIQAAQGAPMPQFHYQPVEQALAGKGAGAVAEARIKKFRQNFYGVRRRDGFRNF